MSTAQSDNSRTHLVLLVTASLAVAFRFWTSLCFFPIVEWNSVRLAPTFMLRFGPSPYPGLDGGPLTTWIYGPVPLLVNLPAVLAQNTPQALLIAGVINLLCALVPVAVALFATQAHTPQATTTDRIWAFLLCLTLWPSTSLHYIQADNTALAFGLISNVLLISARGHIGKMAIAGLCAALAVWSKQTSAGIVLAQLIWLGIAIGLTTAATYALTCALIGLAMGGIFVAWFGFSALWLNLAEIPGRVPFCESLLNRTLEFPITLTSCVVLPLVGLVVARRWIWKRNSVWLLPVLTWVCLLPTALLSAYKAGGAVNSLNGYLYVLPSAALATITAVRQFTPRTCRAWTTASILAILTRQLEGSPILPVQPMTVHLIEAEYLAREFPKQIYFPWHPLVTFFSERRFYHAEDGLYTRQTAGLEITPEAAKLHLPASWSMTAVPGWRYQGVFRQFQPPSAQTRYYGKWTIYVWPNQTGSDLLHGTALEKPKAVP